MIVDLLSGVGVSRHIGQTCCHNFVRRVSIHSQKVNRKCEERCSFNMRSINSQESLSDADVGLCNNENHIDPEGKSDCHKEKMLTFQTVHVCVSPTRGSGIPEIIFRAADRQGSETKSFGRLSILNALFSKFGDPRYDKHIRKIKTPN
ncbi:uncharacterized protein LOC111248591 isoform X1 [Varroa destructor]|uniref:Uncharacterized protein n=1 Tax=Varroa destructor TaxID=109461 RepID=A0A7M7JTC3_VARDE|nr:uncharacterized protein LOC111248591 isoform X1 [Varroa destructor]